MVEVKGKEVKLKGLAPSIDKIVDEKKTQKALNKEKYKAIIKTYSLSLIADNSIK